jgi:hypothetical protein
LCGGERGDFAFPGQGDEQGDGFDEAANFTLDPGDQPFGQPPPGAGRYGLHQRQHRGSEPLGGGKGWDVVHAAFLR